MDWHLYIYLAPAAIMLVALLVAIAMLMPKLKRPTKRPEMLELGLLAALLIVGIYTVYGNFILGRSFFAYHDVGSDTLEQYVPYYLNLLDSIREGTLGLWNHDFGLGVSFMSYQSWTLDPFNLVLIPLGLAFGNGALSTILVFTQALKIVLCGMLMDFILCRYCELPLSRILGSTLLAFCGFLMLWGQHYWLGSALVMAVAITLALELLLERWTAPRCIAVAALTAASIMMSAYSGFMIMIYATVYAVLRTCFVLRDLKLRTFASRFGRLTAPVVCGIAISCLTLIPYGMLILNESSRITSTVGQSGGSTISRALGYITDFVPPRWIPMILSRLLGNSLVSIGDAYPADLVPTTANFGDANVYEFLQLGFSAGALILLGQFAHWLYTEAPRRTKILVSIAGALCILYCVNSFLPALTNIFVGPKYRSAFALAIPACIAMSMGWEKRVMATKVSLPILGITGLATLGIEAWSLFNAVSGKTPAAAFGFITLVLIAALLTSNRRPQAAKRPAAHALVIAMACMAIIASSLADGYLTTNRRAWATAQSFPVASEPNEADDTMEAINWLKQRDTGLYRIEKLFTDWTRLEDSLVQGYMGVASYCSTLDSDVAEFYQKLWPNMVGGDWAYQVYINDPDQPELLNMLGVKYVLAHDVLDFPWAAQINHIGDVYIYQVEGTERILNLHTDVYSETEADNMVAAGTAPLLNICTIVPDEIAAELRAAYPNNNEPQVPGGTFVDQIDGAGEGGGTNDQPQTAVSLNKDGSLSGTVVSQSDGNVACLAIPHTNGWNIYLDGQKVETYRANYGFIGFTVSTGTHTFEARFEPAGVMPAIVVSTAGAVSLVALCVVKTITASKTNGKHAASGKA